MTPKEIYFELCDKYIETKDRTDIVEMAMIEYAQQQVKNLNIPAVSWKQTAVEWLQDTWGNYPDLCTWDKIQEWFEQAKQMEKEQMENFFKAGVKYGSGSVMANEWGEDTTELNFEQYYNETFKSE